MCCYEMAKYILLNEESLNIEESFFVVSDVTYCMQIGLASDVKGKPWQRIREISFSFTSHVQSKARHFRAAPKTSPVVLNKQLLLLLPHPTSSCQSARSINNSAIFRCPFRFRLCARKVCSRDSGRNAVAMSASATSHKALRHSIPSRTRGKDCSESRSATLDTSD